MGNNQKALKTQLIFMNFLQFAVWGAYLTCMGAYLGRVGLGDNIGTFYSQTCFDYILNLIYSLIYSSTYTKNHNYKSFIDKETVRK